MKKETKIMPEGEKLSMRNNPNNEQGAEKNQPPKLEANGPTKKIDERGGQLTGRAQSPKTDANIQLETLSDKTTEGDTDVAVMKEYPFAPRDKFLTPETSIALNKFTIEESTNEGKTRELSLLQLIEDYYQLESKPQSSIEMINVLQRYSLSIRKFLNKYPETDNEGRQLRDHLFTGFLAAGDKTKGQAIQDLWENGLPKQPGDSPDFVKFASILGVDPAKIDQNQFMNSLRSIHQIIPAPNSPDIDAHDDSTIIPAPSHGNGEIAGGSILPPAPNAPTDIHSSKNTESSKRGSKDGFNADLLWVLLTWILFSGASAMIVQGEAARIIEQLSERTRADISKV